MEEKTKDTSKYEDTDMEHSTLPRRDSDPHWLLNELNEILEKGMFKHD